MKKLRGSFAAKTTAVVLLSLLAVLCVLAAFGTCYLYDSNAYTRDYASIAAEAVRARATDYCYEAGENYRHGNVQPLYEKTNFRYTITDLEGKELLSTYAGEDALWDDTVQSYPSFNVEHTSVVNAPREDEPFLEDTPDAPVTPTPRPTQIQDFQNVIRVYCYDTGETLDFASDAELIRWRNENALLVHGYVLRDLPAADRFSTDVQSFTLLWRWRLPLPVIAGVSFLLGILLFVFLLSAAGHRDETDTVTASFIDRIPLDVLAVLAAAGISLILALTFSISLRGSPLNYIAFAVLMLGAALLFLLFCMSFAVRVKLGTLWQNVLLVKLWKGCGELLKKGGRFLLRGLRALPLLGRWVLILGAFLLLELLVLAMSDGSGEVLWLLHLLLFCPAALFLIWNMRRLRLGAKEIAGGNLESKIDTKYLYGELKDHAEDLNHIRDGLNTAVAERMKSEHFQSELITNVSHDIKTPLTSIINYVDLLGKEELENETAKGYVEVLARQSARLKKLLDDLLEASKASTGALHVEPERLDLAVLLDQCVGEYSERLGKAELELVLLKPDEPVPVWADGRHMWRIFDNLLGNIVKYAQPGTRVYLNLVREESKAVVTFRNISREALNLSGEELMERFVRGDSSRNTEGSGLGLAIARSLTQLQGGTMELTVDGDLFKVVLQFDCME